MLFSVVGKFAQLTFVGSIVSILSMSSAIAWSLKTHVWITQQVLNDASDGQLTIAGRNYAIPPHILSALQLHPDKYLMGGLGPDVFPDPVVGQMTTHPGIEDGWKTDEWLKHVLDAATSPEQIAFAYGFIAHAAGDIFAHSYVNAYAGDIFLLTDGERDVELRHFVLEKYIESLTPHPTNLAGQPLNLSNDLGSPSAFLRDTLVFGGDVSRQNLKSKAGYHLTAMHEVHHAVGELKKGANDVLGKLTSFGAKYFEQQLKLDIDIASGKIAIEAAKAAVAVENVVLKVKREAYEAALRALNEANKVIQDHPELITHNERLLAEQIKVAADVAAEATRIGAEVADAINNLNNQINSWANQLADISCDAIPYLGDLNPLCALRDKVKDARDRINVLGAGRQAAFAARDAAAKTRDDLKALVDRLRNEYETAVKGVANKTYEAAILAAETEVKAQEAVLKIKQKAVAEAEAVVDKLSKQLEKLLPIVQDIKKAIDRYNPVTLLIQKWQDDIGVGTEEYLKASHRAGLLMLQNTGNPLKEYQDWYACYGQVFQAAPKEIGQIGCLVTNFIRDVQSEYDRFMDNLPEIVRWIVSPSREIQRRVKEKIKPGLEKATFRIVGFLTDPKTADFLELLSHPKYASRERLVEAYRRDDSGKGLLAFPDVASVVEQDLNIEGGLLKPEKFPALTHAVTLAKLALLAPEELNRLMRDLAETPNLPSNSEYPPYAGNFSMLLDAVRSIDGNHQWQGYGLPYARRLGVHHAHPRGFHYGEDGFKNRTKGFRFWTDIYLRERVFIKLFPGGVIGALGNRPELKWRHYRFPACAQHPYPHTQKIGNGEIVNEDSTCSSISNPDREISQLQTATAAEFRDNYFQCGKPNAELPHWTVAGSYRSARTAQRDAEKINNSFPDMSVEVWRPQSREKHWTIMAAACTTTERAHEARDILIRRGIARDAFVWRPHLPWAPAPPRP